MSYDSTFMLYTSLETARPIAHGRMHTATHPPVLTGVAVASASYLDKPEQAGYFIFPDLSVRHEGWYRLRFSLFESVKHYANADCDKTPPKNEAAYGNPDYSLSLSNRMEVQSQPFQVFSAKKFKGLGESTFLSKSLAEQGCRVRIRRQVRLRKRPAKDDSDDQSTQPSPAPSYHGTQPSPAPSYHGTQPSPAPSYRGQQPSQAPPYHATQPSPASSYHEHIRTGSNSSSYYPTEIRGLSQSRQPSIASLTQPSPSSMLPMAPPPPRQEQSPSMPNSSFTTQLPPIRQEYGAQARPDYGAQPRLEYGAQPRPEYGSQPPASSNYNPYSRQYTMPDNRATKRSHSPAMYDSNSAMKAGQRPDRKLEYKPLTANDPIEADDNPDADDNNDEYYMGSTLEYTRASGERHFKRAW
jgi:hypothetical protein